MSYREKTQKEVKLPSGATVTVRARTRREDIEIGQPPGWVKRHKEGDETTPEQDHAWNRYLAEVEKVLLTRCLVGPLTDGDERLAVIAADPEKVEAGQLSWLEVSREDREAIIAAINELSGLGNAGRGASDTFQDETKDRTERAA